ncbi:beta-ketoacyl-[acyl-carrier-protein] synthase II, partial [Pseudoalteromonas sp. GABNS16A]|nr:beta-ketoacyl-[acyl-carrier-protein] synthase II [Pseudoalteromonas sp. GABNS16A]
MDCVPLSQKHRIDTLIDIALEQISPTLNRFSHIDKSRIAVVVGTSTSGVHDGEQARADHDSSGVWP